MAIKKLIIAFAGPLVNCFIAIITLAFYERASLQIQTIVYANLLLAIFNLLPIYPLDGGRILQEIIHMIKGKEKAYEVVNYIAKVTTIILTIVTSILILYIHNIAFVIILSYLWYLVIKNEQNYQMKKRIYELLN